MKDLEFNREEKILILKNSVAISSRNESYWSMLLKRPKGTFSKKDLEDNVKKSNLEKQAYGMLLHKIEKGEAR